MSTASTTWVLNLSENIIPKFKTMQDEGKKAGEKIEDSFNKAENSLERTTTSSNKLGDSFKKIKAMDWYAVSNGIQSLSDKLTDATKPGVDFDTQLHELKALTGATDEQMQKMSVSARNLSKEFGGSGADQLSSYQSILGKLGPEIAQNDAALSKMGRNVSILSKTMQGDVTGATDALTNSLIQFQVNLDDPMKAAEEMDRMMNVMVASAKAGSVEVPNISKALSEAGGVAKMINISFEETNAMLQGMAKGGVELEKLGVAGRNVMLKMSAPSSLSKDAFKFLDNAKVNMKIVSDTSIPFVDRLKELSKISGNLDAVAAIFGAENVQGANAMLSTIKYQEDLTKQITGTSAAYEMSATIMESWSEKMKRYKANIDDWKVSLFNATTPIIPFVQGGAAMLATGADIANIYSGLSPVFASLGTWIRGTAAAQKIMSIWTGVVTAAQWAWNAAMTANPIGLIIVGVAALIALVVVIIKKWDDWGAALSLFMGPVGLVIGGFKSIYDHWESIKKSFQTEGIMGGLKRLGVVLSDALLKPLQQISGWIDIIFGTDWSSKIKSLRTSLDLVTDSEKKDNPSKQHTANGITFIGGRTNKSEADRLLDAAEKLGYTGGEAGYADWVKKQAEEKKVTTISPNSILGTTKKEKPRKAGKDSETSVSGNGASVRTINVRVDMKNYFNVSKSYGSLELVANQVVGKINDRLRDAIVAID